MTLNILPIYPLDDKRHSLRGYAEVTAYSRRPLSGLCSCSDVNDLPLGQLRGRVLAASLPALRMSAGAAIIPAGVYPPPLRFAVDHVVQLGAKRKMRRIAAEFVVARMQHHREVSPGTGVGHTRKRHASVKLERYTVRSLHSPRPSDDSVSVRAHRQRPRPTFSRSAYVYLSPETITGDHRHTLRDHTDNRKVMP